MTNDITVTVSVRNQSEVDAAAIRKASTWFGADDNGALPDGRTLTVKHVGNPEAADRRMTGDHGRWNVDIVVGPPAAGSAVV